MADAVASAAKALRSRKKDEAHLRSLLSRLEAAQAGRDFSGPVERACGAILIALGDREAGKAHLRRAAALEPPDLPAAIQLARELRRDGELAESSAVGAALIARGYGDPARHDLAIVREVVSCYWLPLLWNGETRRVLEATASWRDAGPLRGSFGVLQAQALRTAAAHAYDSEQPDGGLGAVEVALVRAVRVLDELFALEGYVGVLVAEGMKLVEQLVYAARRQASTVTPEGARQFVDFTDRHLALMCQAHRLFTLDSPAVRKWIEVLGDLEVKPGPNPLRGARWRGRPEARDRVRGRVLVQVYYRPVRDPGGPPRPYLFACDEAERQYFVGRAAFEDGDDAWCEVKVGDRLLVQVDRGVPANGEKAMPVRKARRYEGR